MNEKNPKQVSEAGLSELETDISNTRSNLSKTIAELTLNTKPSQLPARMGEVMEKVEVRARAAVREELAHAKEEAKELLHQGVGEAKTAARESLDEVEQRLRRGAIDVKDGISEQVNAAYTGAKKDLRAATLGRVETLATELGDTMNETRETLMETVRSNPIPAVMVGAGVVWLLMGRNTSAGGRKSSGGGRGKREGAMQELAATASAGLHKATDAVGHAAHEAKEFAGKAAADASEAASGLVHKASDAASTLAHDASEAAASAAGSVKKAASAVGKGVSGAATSIGEGARSGAKRVGQAYEGTMRDNPLVLGGAAVVVGVALGLALPRTRVEDSVLGAQRDRLLVRAGDAAHHAAGQVAGLAERSVEAASNALEGESSRGA